MESMFVINSQPVRGDPFVLRGFALFLFFLLSWNYMLGLNLDGWMDGSYGG